MAIFRVQRIFSIWSDAVSWGKKFTPRIPLGENSKLFILWPGTLVGAEIGALIGIIKKIRGNHCSSGSGFPKKDLHKVHHDPVEKRFSDVPVEADVNLYCDEIPGYEKLIVLQTYNNHILRNLSEDSKKFIYKYFPSILNLVKPLVIKEYREDYIKDGRDYAEILFVYGGELVYLWDFDTKSWYVMDKTYNPAKEWKIKDNDILEAIRQNFDPEQDELLSRRLTVLERDRQGENGPEMRKYIKAMLNAIDIVKKVK